jgi:CubicO group peptidase (beta-lactamase class C family)
MNPPGRIRALLEAPLTLSLDIMNPRSNLYRAIVTNPGSGIVHDPERIYARNLEVPSGGGVGTARAIARAYSAFATCEWQLGLRQETIDQLAAPAIPPTHSVRDECLKVPAQFSLGFLRPGPDFTFGSAASFGHPGAGGAFAYADPAAGVAYAYVTCQARAQLINDPRDVALRTALDGALARVS